MTSEKTTSSWQPNIKLKLKTTITLEKQEKPLAQGVRALFFEFLSRKTGKTIRLKKLVARAKII